MFIVLYDILICCFNLLNFVVKYYYIVVYMNKVFMKIYEGFG